MKIRLKPVPHIIIWSFSATDSKTGVEIENHLFFTKRAANKFMLKHADKLPDCQIGYGGQPLWFW